MDTALVTGCASGIVRATAQELARQGFRVVATARKVDDNPLELLQITDEHEAAQVKGLHAVKADRDGVAVDRALSAVRSTAADPEANLLPALLDAARAYATLGETMHAMGDVFGYYTETPIL